VQQSWLYKIVVLPKYLGELIFTIIAKDDASESSKFILGYLLLAALILIIFGIISPETVNAFFDYFFT
jgi:hypothetical protein